MSQVPPHFTKATLRMLSPAFCPMILAIFAATASPPTGQPFTGASPFAIAFAIASHPAYPQPPQLFPGSCSLTCCSFSSISTANFFPANPRKSPRSSPVPPTITAASMISMLIRHSSFLFQTGKSKECDRHQTGCKKNDR